MNINQIQQAYWQRIRQQQIYRAYAAASSKKSENKNAYDKIGRVSQDDNWFLNYIEYDAKNLDSDKAFDYFMRGRGNVSCGRCSGVHKGSMVLRQLDWYYNNEAEFVIKMKKCPAKGVLYDSIGVTAASPKLTTGAVKDLITTSRYSDYFGIIPFATVDGVNEKGVYASSNVVEKNGVDNSSGFGTGSIKCCYSISLVRFILDRLDSVDNLDAFLKTLKLFSINPVFIPYSSHILVADKSGKSKIIEFENGKYELKDYHVMTNFRTNRGLSVDAAGEAIWSTVEYNGMGVERWKTGINFINDGKPPALSSFRGLRNKLDYSNAYARPYIEWKTWLTDNLSSDISASEAKSYHEDPEFRNSARGRKFTEVLSGYRDLYDNRSRDTGNTWITTHGCIYDLVNLSCNIMSQVGTAEQTEWNILSDGTFEKAQYKRTTGGQWIGRCQAENNIAMLQCTFNDSTGRWDYADMPDQLHIEYKNAEWQVVMVDDIFYSGEIAEDAKQFSANLGSAEDPSVYVFKWVSSSEMVDLNLYSAYDAANSDEGRFSFDNGEEKHWSSQPYVIKVGKDEAFQLCAYATDSSIAELSAWSDGHVGQNISVRVNENTDLSAIFNVHKVSIYVQTENTDGFSIETPEDANLKINSIEKAFNGRNYFDKENTPASVTVESNGRMRFVKWKDTQSADVKWLPLNQSYNLTAVFEEER